MTKSIHDNQITSYSVDSVLHQIIIKTIFKNGNKIENTEIKFNEVIGYFFEGDNFASIVFSIEETNPKEIIRKNTEMFINGQKYCWPGAWNNSIEEAEEYLLKHNIKGYSISSSYGLAGWIMAKEMKIK
jgi:hypothetical protein